MQQARDVSAAWRARLTGTVAGTWTSGLVLAGYGTASIAAGGSVDLWPELGANALRMFAIAAMFAVPAAVAVFFILFSATVEQRLRQRVLVFAAVGAAIGLILGTLFLQWVLALVGLVAGAAGAAVGLLAAVRAPRSWFLVGVAVLVTVAAIVQGFRVP
ncbi:MAG: hypothetical protein GX593_12830 [Actinomycetales bacterium]|nr:hypothetical protein [Actinomycetales bacterium]